MPQPAPPHLPDDGGVALRSWAEGDTAVLRRAFASAEMQHQAPFPIETDTDARRLVETWQQQASDDWAYAFAVVDGDAVVGQVAVSAVNREHDTGWVSYWTSPEARGRGIATRATTALVQWCFDELGLFRLELGHRINNPASCRVALAAGFTVEGVQRAKLRYGRVRFDVELHARLAQ